MAEFCEVAMSDIQKCPHGVYHPAKQKFAHGCYLCNPKLSIPESQPEKITALFRIENGLALSEVPLHAYDTVFELSRDGGARRTQYRYGSPAHAI